MFVLLPRKLLLHELKCLHNPHLGSIHLLQFRQGLCNTLLCTGAPVANLPTAYTASHVLNLNTLQFHTLDAHDLRAWNVRYAAAGADAAIFMLPHSLLEISGIAIDTQRLE